MFIPIDYENWDRKEIYDAFHGYMYCMTVELDITEFLEKIHESHWKFYPSMCYCIAKTVNEHQDYRYAKITVMSATSVRSIHTTPCSAQTPTTSSPTSGPITTKTLPPSTNNSWKTKPSQKPAIPCTTQKKTV